MSDSRTTALSSTTNILTRLQPGISGFVVFMTFIYTVAASGNTTVANELIDLVANGTDYLLSLMAGKSFIFSHSIHSLRAGDCGVRVENFTQPGIDFASIDHWGNDWAVLYRGLNQTAQQFIEACVKKLVSQDYDTYRTDNEVALVVSITALSLMTITVLIVIIAVLYIVFRDDIHRMYRDYRRRLDRFLQDNHNNQAVVHPLPAAAQQAAAPPQPAAAQQAAAPPQPAAVQQPAVLENAEPEAIIVNTEEMDEPPASITSSPNQNGVVI